jgi:hypothetical protein
MPANKKNNTLTVTWLLRQAAVERSRALLTEKRVAGVRLEEELAALREDEVDIALAIRQKQGANAALQVRGRRCSSRGRAVSPVGSVLCAETASLSAFKAGF